MSGIFETKEKILKSLSNKPKTGKQLAEELGLTTATLNQHLQELEQKGLIHESEGTYSKRWKYYEVNSRAYEKFATQTNVVRNAAGAFILVIAVIAAAVVLLGNGVPRPTTAITTVQPTGQSASSTNTAMITPGGSQSAASACFFLGFSPQNVTMGPIVGFRSYNVSNYTDLVIAPGHVGTINYTLEVVPLSQNANSNMTLHLYNTAFLSHRSSNSTLPDTTTPGINLTYIPQNYTGPYPSNTANYTFQIRFNVSSNATQGTYWMRIATCEGISMPMLVTIGNKPYNGTVQVMPNIYA